MTNYRGNYGRNSYAHLINDTRAFNVTVVMCPEICFLIHLLSFQLIDYFSSNRLDNWLLSHYLHINEHLYIK